MLVIDLELLRKWRGERTHDEVAKLIGMSKSNYFNIESGTRRDIRISTLGKIAKAMKIDPAKLLKWEK